MTTVSVALSALAVGLILAFLGALGELSHNRWVSRLTLSGTALIRGVPELLVLFGIYFGGSALLSWLTGHDLQVNAFIAGAVALGLIFAAYGAQTLRGAFLAIPHGNANLRRRSVYPPDALSLIFYFPK